MSSFSWRLTWRRGDTLNCFCTRLMSHMAQPAAAASNQSLVTARTTLAQKDGVAAAMLLSIGVDTIASCHNRWPFAKGCTPSI